MPLSNYALLTAAPGSGNRYNPSRPGTFQWDTLKRAYVIPQTGALYTGPLGTGNYSINGQHSTTPPPGTADLNTTPGSDITVSHTPLQPALAALTDRITGNAGAEFDRANASLTAALPGLEDIATRAYTRSQGAFDTGKIESQLSGSLDAQEKAQRALLGEQGQRNMDYAASTNANLAQLASINAENAANMRAAGERSVAASITATNAIPLMRGQNPEVRSGAQPSRVAATVANALQPWQQAITAQKYATVANYQQPWQRELYGQDVALNQAKSVLESALGQNRRANFQYVDALWREASRLDPQQANQLIAQRLMLAGFPTEFLSRQTSLLRLVSDLRRGTYEDLPSQPVDTSQFVGGPGFSAPGIERSYRPGGNAQDGTGPNARGWRDWSQSGAVGAPAQPMPPAGTLEGDIARGMPDWVLTQRYGFGGPQRLIGNEWTGPRGGAVDGVYLGDQSWRNTDDFYEPWPTPVISPYE